MMSARKKDLKYKWPSKTILVIQNDRKNKIYLNIQDNHAEILFLKELENELHVDVLAAGMKSMQISDSKNKDKMNVYKWYINYSPCKICALAMAKFISANPTFKFDIKYAKTYTNVDGVKQLVKEKHITLATLDGDGWKSCMTQILKIHIEKCEKQSDWASHSAKLNLLKTKLEDGSDQYASLQELITELGFEPDPVLLIKLRKEADQTARDILTNVESNM